MSPDTEKPAGPGKVKKFFSSIAAIPRKLWGISLAARASCLTTIILVIIVAVVWTLFLLDPANVPWRHSMSALRIFTVLILVVIIPLVVYRGLRLWLDGETSQFPDIDFAWRAGIDALERSGISLKSTPLFLIIGSADDVQEKAIMGATRLDLRVRMAPEGSAPLHWYANADGVYLFVSEAGWSTALARARAKRSLEVATSMYGNLEAPAPVTPYSEPLGATATSTGGSPGVAPEPHAPTTVASVAPPPSPPQAPPPPAGSPKGTIMLDQYADALSQATPTTGAASQPTAGGPVQSAGGIVSPPPGAGAPAGSRGTMMLDVAAVPAGSPPPSDAPSGAAQATAAPVIAAPAAQPVSPTAAAGAIPDSGSSIVGTQDSAEQLQRLEYVCHLLRRARQPLCPVNGILVLEQFELIQASAAEAAELQRAVNADLSAAQHALQLRCPVTTLIVGLENERGFQELVRRVGAERAAAQRFGRGHDARSLATPDELRALCVHVCGAFEDWVYTLFREQGALMRPGNRWLYGLLCKVRCNLKQRLSDILAEGFGHNPTQHPDDDPILFSGCYFAATGDTDDRQAFVKGVFDKLVDEQENVEWTRRAIRTSAMYRFAAFASLAISAALVIFFIVMVVFQIFFA